MHLKMHLYFIFEIELNPTPHRGTGEINPLPHGGSGRYGPPYQEIDIFVQLGSQAEH